MKPDGRRREEQSLIMDNLIAEGKAKSFIIVMDNSTWTMSGPQKKRKRHLATERMGGWFTNTLLKDIIPDDRCQLPRWPTKKQSDGGLVDGRYANPRDYVSQSGCFFAD